jgi:hypothetical protein
MGSCSRAALTPEAGLRVSVDLGQERVDVRGWADPIVSMAAQIGVRPKQLPDARHWIERSWAIGRTVQSGPNVRTIVTSRGLPAAMDMNRLTLQRAGVTVAALFVLRSVIRTLARR